MLWQIVHKKNEERGKKSEQICLANTRRGMEMWSTENKKNELSSGKKDGIAIILIKFFFRGTGCNNYPWSLAKCKDKGENCTFPWLRVAIDTCYCYGTLCRVTASRLMLCVFFAIYSLYLLSVQEDKVKIIHYPARASTASAQSYVKSNSFDKANEVLKRRQSDY